MRYTELFITCFLYTSFVTAWPWPPSVPKVEGPIIRRQGDGIASASSSTDPLASTLPNSDSIKATETASASAQPTSASATITGSSNPSATATSGGSQTTATGKSATTGKKTGTSNTTATATSSISIDPRLPAGGVEMLTPSALAVASYYKIGDYVTFGWNYTSLVVTPTAVDIMVSCSANSATYTLSNNATVGPTGAVVWDTSRDINGTNPLLTETYTLVIHDAAKDITAVPSAGYLGTYDQFTFGMYAPQQYTPLNDYVCATCSGALSEMERQTLKFLFGMGIITVVSFTWFAGGVGVLF